MTKAQQYDEQKQEVADRLREMDAVDEVLEDLKSLRNVTSPTFTQYGLEALIEDVEEWVNYNENLEYILRNVPNDVKALLAG